MQAAISISNISKSYGQVAALKNISFDVNDGELFGLIGPDGAGKSSLFRILTTLILADKGEANVVGLNVAKDHMQIRQRIGYMPGRFSLYQDLTVQENLDFFATIFKTSIEENYHLIKEIYVQLEPFKKRPAGKLSGGMKQKLALCCALIHKPDVLFLDEPTTGVDPVSRKEFWQMLKRLKAQGIAILVSTPYMDEAALCDRIALIQKGKILKIDSPEHIHKDYDGNLFSVKSKDTYGLIQHLRSLPQVNSCYAFGEYLHVTLNVSLKETTTLLEAIKAENFNDLEWKKSEPGIEDVFMQLLSKSSDESLKFKVQSTSN
ncbi:MAG: ABC transporter ATP-binding protein [Bacteroidia bacterium]